MKQSRSRPSRGRPKPTLNEAATIALAAQEAEPSDPFVRHRTFCHLVHGVHDPDTIPIPYLFDRKAA